MFNLLKQATILGGNVLKKYFRQNISVSYKRNIHDLVTKADKEAQRVIIEYLKKETKKTFPKYKFGFLGEEGINEQGDYVFIIDPLDGTINFTTGIDHFCISIAVCKKNIIEYGLVYNVLKNDFYYAQKGRGAYKNNKKLILSKEIKLQNVVLLTHFSGTFLKGKETIDFLLQIADSIRTIRIMGSLILDLCRMAENIGDIYLNNSCYVWDIAAARLLFEEAGGEVKDWNGKDLVYDLNNSQKKYNIVAAEKKLLNKFLLKLSSR